MVLLVSQKNEEILIKIEQEKWVSKPYDSYGVGLLVIGIPV